MSMAWTTQCLFYQTYPLTPYFNKALYIDLTKILSNHVD